MTDALAYTETEERIFNAALKVFSRKGKDGARMQEIAEEAGINKALLHYYFRSKDRLYRAVFSHVFREFMGALRDPLKEDSSFSEILRRFIDGFMSIHAEHPEISRLWILENLSGAPVVGPMLKQYLEENVETVPRLFIERVQSAIEAGEIRAVDPFHTFITVIGACVFFFLAFPTLSSINPMLAMDRDGAVETRKKHLFDILYNGLAINHAQ